VRGSYGCAWVMCLTAHDAYTLVGGWACAAMESDVRTLGVLLAQLASLSVTLADAPAAAVEAGGQGDGNDGEGRGGDDASGTDRAAVPAAAAGLAPVDAQTLEQRRARMAAVRASVEGALTVLSDPRRYVVQEDDFAELHPDTYQPLSVRHGHRHQLTSDVLGTSLRAMCPSQHEPRWTRLMQGGAYIRLMLCVRVCVLGMSAPAPLSLCVARVTGGACVYIQRWDSDHAPRQGGGRGRQKRQWCRERHRDPGHRSAPLRRPVLAHSRRCTRQHARL
jgi:hypothetical protein